MPNVTSRRVLMAPALALLALWLAACTGPGAASPAPSPSPATSGGNAVVRSTAAADSFVPILPNSDLAVGQNRFLIALIDDQQKQVTDADVHLRFFSLEGDEGTFKTEAPAQLIRSGDKSLYATQVTFDQAGPWGVEAQATRDGEQKAVRARFEVKPDSLTPSVGEAAPRSKTKTATDPAAVAAICTAHPVDDMHALTIEEAVTSGKPSVILFGTPAYCSSQTCGPALEAVQEVQAKYRDKVNFVHVEIYENLTPGPFVDAVKEWNLPSDPWVFVVDREGKVSAKFEAMISAQELEPAVAAVAG